MCVCARGAAVAWLSRSGRSGAECGFCRSREEEGVSPLPPLSLPTWPALLAHSVSSPVTTTTASTPPGFALRVAPTWCPLPPTLFSWKGKPFVLSQLVARDRGEKRQKFHLHLRVKRRRRRQRIQDKSREKRRRNERISHSIRILPLPKRSEVRVSIVAIRCPPYTSKATFHRDAASRLLWPPCARAA